RWGLRPHVVGGALGLFPVLGVRQPSKQNHGARRASTSARSFVRPTALLFAIRAWSPRKCTGTSPYIPLCFEAQASSQDTPVMLVIRWICTGIRPNCRIFCL